VSEFTGYRLNLTTLMAARVKYSALLCSISPSKDANGYKHHVKIITQQIQYAFAVPSRYIQMKTTKMSSH